MDTAVTESESLAAGRVDDDATLVVDALTCARSERIIFSGVSFALGPGGVVQIEGANGSGKTTLLRAICGLVPSESGAVTWRGTPIEDDDRFLAELSYVGHVAGVKEDLTARENLRAAAALAARDGLDAAGALDRLGLGWALDTPVRHLSAGQRRRIALARLLVAPGKVWVLDEPLAALDARSKAVLEGLIDEHAARGGLVLISTHQALSLATPEVVLLAMDGAAT